MIYLDFVFSFFTLHLILLLLTFPLNFPDKFPIKINLKILLISLKFGMMVIIFTFRRSLFAEPIHIELPNIRRKIRMLEIQWQNCRSKFINIDDNKTNAIMMPSNNILILFILLSNKLITSKISYVFKRNADFF